MQDIGDITVSYYKSCSAPWQEPELSITLTILAAHKSKLKPIAMLTRPVWIPCHMPYDDGGDVELLRTPLE